MLRRFLLPTTVILLAACSDELPSGPEMDGPNYLIADAARNYKAGFYWHPPLVQQEPLYSGQFDAAAMPVVEICRLSGDECAQTIATLSEANGALSKKVGLDGNGKFLADWPTAGHGLTEGNLYRVSVFAGNNHVLLGYADIQPISSTSFTNVNTNEFIKLKEGGILPIMFRIETGVVGSIEVQPIDATAEQGATQQFVAVVRDLHGNIMSSADVEWESSDEGVATINEDGLATAIEDGEVTITATSERVNGSTTLRVEGGDIVVRPGRAHACALDQGGRAFCWGRNEFGQVGDGSVIDRRSPVAVAGDHRFTAIATGSFNTCGIKSTGQAFCWGLNQSGEAGDGTTTRRQTPVAVLGGLQFVSISLGSSNTCGITVDRRAYCWGQGSFGAVGNGLATAHVTSPALVAGGHEWAAIESGSQYTCGLTTANAAYCWGNQASGRLGNGNNNIDRFTPFPVSGGHAFTTISTGTAHVCAIDVENRAFCWGAGAFGRLGNNSGNSASTPQPVLGGVLFAQISAGGGHTCGVSTTGQGYCWGGDFSGNLATGTFSNLVPRLVVGGRTWTHIIASEVFASPGGGSSFAFTCGVTVENQILCWGSNFFGQIGDGTAATQRGSPTPVSSFP